MTYHGWQEVIGAVGIFGMVIVVVTIVVWNLAATWRARSILARDYAYRRLAEQAVHHQDTIDRQLAGIDGRLAEVQTRIRSVERILKEVE